MAKLILTQEVAGLGTDGDVVEVKNGYARHYLLPRGFATVWTKGGEKQVESLQKARAARAVEAIRSGDHPREVVHLMRPEGSPAGLLVIVHGGYWMRFSPDDFLWLAEGALARSPASYAVAVTGIAGPDGGTPAKPVGY